MLPRYPFVGLLCEKILAFWARARKLGGHLLSPKFIPDGKLGNQILLN